MGGNGANGSAPISQLEVRDQLSRILASFRAADRQKKFLDFIVEEALAGRSSDIKEVLIAQEVYGRGAEYDPKIDSIVRVEAARVRGRLRDYYAGPGHTDPIVLEIAKGSYVPVFRRAVVDTAPQIIPAPQPTAPESNFYRHRMLLVGAAAAAIVAVIVAFLTWRPAPSSRAKAEALYTAAKVPSREDADWMLRRGPASVERPDFGELNRSITQLEQAVAIDPAFALGYAALTDRYRFAAEYDPRMLAKARLNGRRAIALDPKLADAHFNLGFIYLLFDWNVAAAVQEFRACLALQPRTLSAYRLLADALSILGRPDEALHLLDQGRAVYPNNPVVETSTAVVLYNAHRFREMETQARRTVKQFPDFHLGHWALGLALEQLNHLPEAIHEERICLRESPGDGRCTSAIGHMFAKSGRSVEANGVLAGFLARPPNLSKVTYLQALIYNGLGKTDLAYANLDAAIATREFDVTYMRVEPRLENLRFQPRFQVLLKKAGLSF